MDIYNSENNKIEMHYLKVILTDVNDVTTWDENLEDISDCAGDVESYLESEFTRFGPCEDAEDGVWDDEGEYWEGSDCGNWDWYEFGGRWIYLFRVDFVENAMYPEEKKYVKNRWGDMYTDEYVEYRKSISDKTRGSTEPMSDDNIYAVVRNLINKDNKKLIDRYGSRENFHKEHTKFNPFLGYGGSSDFEGLVVYRVDGGDPNEVLKNPKYWLATIVDFHN